MNVRNTNVLWLGLKLFNVFRYKEKEALEKSLHRVLDTSRLRRFNTKTRGKFINYPSEQYYNDAFSFMETSLQILKILYHVAFSKRYDSSIKFWGLHSINTE